LYCFTEAHFVGDNTSLLFLKMSCHPRNTSALVWIQTIERVTGKQKRVGNFSFAGQFYKASPSAAPAALVLNVGFHCNIFFSSRTATLVANVHSL
jgi:hypothetical protein